MDNIDKLPVDKTKPIPEELQTLQKYLKCESKRAALFMEFQDVFYATVLFGIMSTGFFDKCIGMIPWTGSPFIKWIVKLLVYAVILYAILLVVHRK